MRGTTIDYRRVLERLLPCDAGRLGERLHETLPPLWQRAYRKMAQSPTNIRRFSDHGYEVMFDHASQLVSQGVLGEDRAVEDRVIVAFGRSDGGTVRQAGGLLGGLLGPCSRAFGGRESDTSGGRALGGGPDVILFPMRRAIHREWSIDGRIYRAMERYCAEKPDTFCFSRPIYTDRSWTPRAIEYGVLRETGQLWVRQIENVEAPLRISRALVHRGA